MGGLPITEHYTGQVQLLVQLLPLISWQPQFALKGGTAINLFYYDLPRLSVDVDLIYLPSDDWETSLRNISSGLNNIATDIKRALPHTRITRGKTSLQVNAHGRQVKIEVSPVIRRTVHAPHVLPVSPVVEEQFGWAEMTVASIEDLFAGKIHAALDRQHPRDLFDIQILLDNQGISEKLFRTLFVYIASSPRPVHELLAPSDIDLSGIFERAFVGLTTRQVTPEELQRTKQLLLTTIRDRLGPREAEILRSIQAGEPDFTTIGLPHANDFPAVKWKQQNIQKLILQDPNKHKLQLDLLHEVLNRA